MEKKLSGMRKVVRGYTKQIVSADYRGAQINRIIDGHQRWRPFTVTIHGTKILNHWKTAPREFTLHSAVAYIDKLLKEA